MPEGDTVHLAARRLHHALAGKTLTRGELRVPRFATEDLAGRTVTEVVAKGKHLLFRMDGAITLHTHFKMEGSWHLYRHGQRWHGPDFQVRAVLANIDWVAVGFRLAIVELIGCASEPEVVGHLGPDPLGDDWDSSEALTRLRARPERTIGEALLDQTIMAGPGNVYRCEVCFLRGFDPWTPVGLVDEPAKIVDLMKRLMEVNRARGDQVTTGDTRPGRERWVYGRGGEPCRRCGTKIERAEQGRPPAERVTYWCPSCQPSKVRAGT